MILEKESTIERSYEDGKRDESMLGRVRELRK